MVDGATPHVDASLTDPHSPLAEIDVFPTQTRDLAAPQAGQSEMPRMAIAVVDDAAQNCPNVLGGERLKLSTLARHAIDQSGNVSRQVSLGDQLSENLREGTEHVVARARAPRLARPATGPLQAPSAELHDQLVDMSASQVLDNEGTELAADGLQNVFVARRGSGSDPVARPQPIRAGLL